LQMCSYHLFEPIACTPASGWEKGQVENQVDTGRCNFFTPLVKVENLEELNIQLERNCIAWAKNHKHPEQRERTIFETYQEERPVLIPYRGYFDSYRIENDLVSPYCFVRYATNCYSVECSYVSKPVQVRIYAKEIMILYGDKIIGHHKRSFERYQRIYDPWHYVPLLERKPGALRNGAPFKQLDLPSSMQRVREQLSCYSDGDKRFIRILLAVIQHGLSAVEKACAEALLEGGCNDVIILKKLQPIVHEIKQDHLLLKLSFPPTEDCNNYNAAYLSKHTLSVEVTYA